MKPTVVKINIWLDDNIYGESRAFPGDSEKAAMDTMCGWCIANGVFPADIFAPWRPFAEEPDTSRTKELRRALAKAYALDRLEDK